MIEYPTRGWETMDTTSQRATQIPCLNAHIDEENEFNPNFRFAFEWYESLKKFEPETKNFWC